MIPAAAENECMSVAAPTPNSACQFTLSDPATESVWDYPRPPALVPCERRVRIELGGVTIADSTAALRVLETSHPPTIYIPPADIDPAMYPARRWALIL